MNGKPTPFYYVAVAVVVIGLVAFATYRYTRPDPTPDTPEVPPVVDGPKSNGQTKTLDPEALKLLAGVEEIPKLGPPGEYKPQGDTIDVEISEWPGYAPLIWANGGLAPTNDSHFFKQHGFKCKITVSEAEAEGWQRINSGKTAVSVTTVDVLALYGNQLKIEVPIQLDFSRGGDGILTLKQITNINQLKGKRVAVAQYTEAEFFLRFLARETGLEVKPLDGLEAPLDPNRINLLYTKTAEDAGAVFVSSVKNRDELISGAVTWSPFTVEIPAELPDDVRLLVSNRNLLIVADILIVNAGFAKQNPKIVTGLVDGILTGVEEIKKNPDNTLPIVGEAFKDAETGKAKTLAEMKELMRDVHLSNLAENLLFFSTESGQVGTFHDIYLEALYAYGRDTKTAVSAQKLMNREYLDKLAKDARFEGQMVTLGPIKSSEKTSSPLEGDPVLTKQIRFQFEPNSTELDLKSQANQQALKDLAALLQRAPGSYYLLRGHLDNSKVAEFKERGEAFYAKMAKRAVEQSQKRAEAVKQILVKQFNVDQQRLETDGRGWDESLPGATADENRRVEVLWFTLEG